MAELKRVKKPALLVTQVQRELDELSKSKTNAQKREKLIRALENSLKFWELRNKDQISECIVKQYLVASMLFRQKEDEKEKVKSIQTSC